MNIAIINANGRMTIPKEMRERLNIKVGTRLGFVDEDGKIVLQKIKIGYFLRYAGILGTKGEMLKGLMREKINKNN